MLGNPDKYTDLQLLEAGVTAAQGEKQDAAATMFEAALKKNPYSRDGLFNLAATYDALGQTAKMPPVLQKLVAVDPENPENYRLWARYWQARAKELKPGDKATEADVKARNDARRNCCSSFQKFSEAKVKVTFNVLQPRRWQSRAGRDRGESVGCQKQLHVEVRVPGLRWRGARQQAGGRSEVPAKGAKSFRVEVAEEPGVVAFKYAPLP